MTLLYVVRISADTVLRLLLKQREGCSRSLQFAQRRHRMVALTCLSRREGMIVMTRR